MLKNSIFGLLAFSLFSIQTLPAQNLQLLSHLSFPGATLAGCWHYVDALGNEYALVGTSLGLSIVDLNNPTQPKIKFSIPSLPNNWREVKTWAGFAYFGSEAPGSGITIVDLRSLPDTVYSKVWKGDGQYFDKIQTSHTVAAENGWLYVFGGSQLVNGAVICSLADPWNPVITGSYSTNYIHDGYVRGDTLWGSEIYAGQFSVIDISDRANPVLLETQATPGAFNHNSWLSDSGNFLFTTDERSNAPLGAFDVSDLTNIKLVDTYKPSRDSTREVHNVRGLGSFLINPSYGGQLTIVDATHPDNLIETAFASLGTSLVWDADPYLPSGIIFATAKNEGLFVFKPTYQQAAYLEGLVTDASSGNPIPGAKIKLLNSNQPAEVSKLNGVFKTGSATAGKFSVEIEKPGYFSKTVTGILLQNGKIAHLEVELAPRRHETFAANLRKGLSDEPKVSPTLFDRCLTVNVPGKSIFSQQNTKIQVTNLNGKVLSESEIAGLDTEICLDGDLPSGHYLVVLRNENGISRPTKIIKG